MDKNLHAIALFNKLASLYQQKYMDVDHYAEGLDTFCSLLEKKAASIFEIACGPGNITKYLLDKRADFKITGTDLSKNMIELARENNPAASFEQMDCRKLSLQKNTFDAVVCGFCLPYLNDTETQKLFIDIEKLLNKDGVLYMSTIEGNYDKSIYKKGSTGDEIFQHYYSEKHLRMLMESLNLSIIYLHRVPIINDEETNDLILIAKKSN